MKRPSRDRMRMLFAAGALCCAAVFFTLLFSAYIRRFDRTLTEENRSRLEEVSGHVAAYMERAVEQQWKELKVVAQAAGAISDPEERLPYLGRMAKTLEFEYIGLAGEDGLLHATAFREPEDISGEDYFAAARAGKPFMTGICRQIFWDRSVGGVILSLPAPRDAGLAVVAMLSMEKLGEDVQVDSFDGNGFSYIIDAEGGQVLHARSMAYNNLFLALQNLPFEEGYSLEAMRADISARRAGMTAYSDLGVAKYAYYRPLRFNGWTVVSIVPKGVVTARTSALSRELVLLCAAAVLVFLGLSGAVGGLLLRLESRRRANRAKSEFLANMSHDMRTPMNAIMGMAAIAQAHANDPDTVQDCLQKIDFSSRHLLGLINDVLDMSRIESGRMTLCEAPFPLCEVLEGAQSMTALRMRGKGQRFTVRVRDITHEYLVGDSMRLIQVFVNILTNAMKFTPPGGVIGMGIEELPCETPGAALFRFTFSDSGIGMKPAFLKDLFTPFTRERDSRVDRTEGSGLGMAITKRIVDLMGGGIEVSSVEGEGSVFAVTVPLALDPAAPKEPAPPDWRVLLVGDEQSQGEAAADALQGMGLAAGWEPDAGAAAERLRREAYQAVIIDRDAFSPGGARVLRAAGGRAPRLILAACDWEDLREEAAAAGVRDFIQKPLLPSALCRGLRKAAGLTAGEARPAPAIDLSGRRILLAEDNELNLEIARAILTDAGAKTIWAQDGARCVELFEASPVGSIDLILMDIQMPRMDGCEAAACIRALNRADAGVPILAMSANAYAEDIAAAMAAGMDGYLTKPIDTAVWMAEIEKQIRA